MQLLIQGLTALCLACRLAGYPWRALDRLIRHPCLDLPTSLRDDRPPSSALRVSDAILELHSGAETRKCHDDSEAVSKPHLDDGNSIKVFAR